MFSVIERRNFWKRTGGFWVGVGVFSLILVGVPAFLHWLKCWECRKEMAGQKARAEMFTAISWVPTRPLAKPGDVTYIYGQKYVWDGWKWNKAEP